VSDGPDDLDALTQAAWGEVYAAAMEAGGASDHFLAAIADWLDAHDLDAVHPGVVAYLRGFLFDLWHDDFWPEWMGTETWLRTFRHVGFASLSGRPLPARSLVVYRGATEPDRLGMAWTTDRAIAVGHVRRDTGTDNVKRLWRAIVPPEGVLARLDLWPEREVIVDPSYLRDVREVE
jgi:hypothetical protein